MELDVQVGSARGWRLNNIIHQPANDIRGFSPDVFIIENIDEVGDLVPVDHMDVRVDTYWRRGRQVQDRQQVKVRTLDDIYRSRTLIPNNAHKA